MKKSNFAMSFLGMTLFAALTLGSCGNTVSGDKSGQPTADTTKTNVSFVNGITDANKGSHTGPVELKGKIDGVQSGRIFLYETQGRVSTVLDSSAITNGQFSFGKKEFEQGVYMLGLTDKNQCSIILNPAEPICELGFKNGNLESALYAIQSKENEGWAKYMAKEPALLKQIKDARVAGAKSPAMKVQYDQQATMKEAELAALQQSIIAEYPNTHLAKLMTWKQEPPKNDIAKYWDSVDFTDESVIRSKIITDRVETFMRTFSKGEESGFINCVATVADKAKVNDKVLEFTLNQMLTGFYESNMENICMFIIDNYVNGDSCGDADLSNIIKSTAESIQNLSLGKTPPNFSLSGLDGSKVDLYAASSKNKYTLVMFWSSWCEHCKGEAPEVKACYDQWHAKGFETIGVSIDRNKTAWQNAVADRGFTFPNVCGMKEYQSPVAKDYRVTRTPTFFLLDSQHKIVLKPKGIRDVQTFLAKNLK